MENLTFKAVVFDMDGVITKTAKTHALAWKKMFDGYLFFRAKQFDEPFAEFILPDDYLKYVDGKPRYKGVESFLESRNIVIPLGSPLDTPGFETICSLGNRKNEAFNEVIASEGVEVFQSTVDLMDNLISNGIKLGVASSSKNCKQVLDVVNLTSKFSARVDGISLAELGLQGKPEPDIFLKTCEYLEVNPRLAIIVEDAVSGVQAGKKGNFGLVIGLARENNSEELLENGADAVFEDLSDLKSLAHLEQLFMKFSKQ